MRSNQCILLITVLCLTFLAVHLVSAGGGGGGHGHGHGHHGHGGRRNRTQCYQTQQVLNQWFSQSQLGPAFQTICSQVGAAQTWTLIQGLLGVSATGTLDQTTFQALLNNANQDSLAQQLLALAGTFATVSPVYGK